MKGDRELPAPDWRRCDAIAKPASGYDSTAWNARMHRCGNYYAMRWRDGYQLCAVHFEQPNVRYAADAQRFRRIREYAAMMAVALGDDEAAQ